MVHHLQNLREVFQRFKVHVLRVNTEKFVFASDSISFLVYKIFTSDFRSLLERVQALLEYLLPLLAHPHLGKSLRSSADTLNFKISAVLEQQ